MIHRSAVCDNCEVALELSALDEDDTNIDEELMEEGWVQVWLPDDDGVMLCSERCLTVWAAARAIEQKTIEV